MDGQPPVEVAAG